MSQIAQRAIAQSKTKRQQHHIGQPITVQLFGRMITGKIIAVHPFGVVNIETPSGYRLTASGVTLAEVTA
jgi:hypothetical protein